MTIAKQRISGNGHDRKERRVDGTQTADTAHPVPRVLRLPAPRLRFGPPSVMSADSSRR